MTSASKSRTRRAGPIPWWACALALVLAVACDRGADGGSDEVGEGAQRVALTAEKVGDSEVKTRRARRMRPFGKTADRWSVSAKWSGRHVVKSDTDKPIAVLAAVDDNERKYSIAGKYDVSAINEIWLAWHCGGLQNVVFNVRREGKLVASWGPLDLAPSKFPQTQLVYPDWKADGDPTGDVFELVFRGPEKRVGVYFVSVIDRSPTSFGADDGSEELLIGHGESRLAHWANNRRALVGSVRVRADSVLDFCYGVPPPAHEPDSEGELQVSVSDAAGKVVRDTYSLDFDTDGSIWRDARLKLAGLAPGPATVRFDVRVRESTGEAGDEPAAAVALADIWMADGRIDPRPSVLFITTDTVRADHVAALGLGKSVQTPALDALAARGVVFSNCWSSTNTTNPSHGAIFTGLSPRDTGIMDQMTPLSERAVTLAELFRANGYATWATLSARHLGPKSSGLGQGFDRVSWPAVDWERRADETLEFAREWLDRSDGRPVFLWLHVFDAHFPYAPPKGFDRTYYHGDDDPYDESRPPVSVPPGLASNPKFKRMRDLDFERSQYSAEITYLDSELRPFLDELRFRNGVTVVVSDHGECLGEQNVLFDHANLTPSTLHVPLILSWPEAPAGSRTDAPVMSTDIGRTLLGICGVGRGEFPGADLRTYLGAKPVEAPRFAVAASRAEASLTLGRRHLVLQLNNHFEPSLYKPRVKHEVELFDISVDPDCQNNLVDSAFADAKRMRAALVAWLTQSQADSLAGERSTDDELAKGIESLGYVTHLPGGRELWVEDDCEWCQRFR